MNLLSISLTYSLQKTVFLTNSVAIAAYNSIHVRYIFVELLRLWFYWLFYSYRCQSLKHFIIVIRWIVLRYIWWFYTVDPFYVIFQVTNASIFWNVTFRYSILHFLPWRPVYTVRIISDMTDLSLSQFRQCLRSPPAERTRWRAWQRQLQQLESYVIQMWRHRLLDATIVELI